MKRNIKKSYIVFDIILSLLIVFFFINIVFIKNTRYIFNSIFPAIVFIILSLIYGYERRKKRFTYETMFYMFSYSVLYLILIYIIGIFTGFNSSIFRLNLTTIVKNIIPCIILIISSELLRDEVVRKCDNSYISYTLIGIILVLIDCIIFLTTFDLNTGDGQIQFICSILLPSIAKNIFLIYICKIGGVLPTIIYRLIFELKTYIIPIEPDFGLYIESILSTIMPIVFGYFTYFGLKQFQNKEVEGKTLRHSKLYNYLFVIIMVLFVLIVVSLSSCKFMYGSVAIGSGSMTKAINKGDVVLYRRLDNLEINYGDVIIYKKDNKMIVHRVIEIIEVNENEYVYYTKGDANITPDGIPLRREDIVGIVRKRIKYLGIPSVELNELMSKRK